MNSKYFLRVMSQLTTSTSPKSNAVRVAKDDKTFHFHESFLKCLSRYSGSLSEDDVVIESPMSIITSVGNGRERMKYESLVFEESN